METAIMRFVTTLNLEYLRQWTININLIPNLKSEKP
jgi:hypothetical protein